METHVETEHWMPLMESRWGDAVVDPAQKVMVFTRSQVPCVTEDDARAVMEALLSVITAEHATFGLVCDVRAIAGNNTEAFERATSEGLRLVEQSFLRVITVVSSVAGMLQIQRMGRDRETDPVLTDDLANAIAAAAGKRRL